MMKIELIQDKEGWNWVILKFDEGCGWHNVGCGYAAGYDEACAEAKKDYEAISQGGRKKAID